MRLTIHQPQYIPWVPYFDKVLYSDKFVLLDNVQFQKNGIQNRNQIKSPQGALWLTIPVKQNFGQLISETKIADIKQLEKHLKTIEQFYKKASYFQEVYGILKNSIDQKSDNLCSVSCNLISNFLDYMGYKGEVILASQLGCSGNASDLVLNICKALNVTEYVSGDGGKNYLNLQDFKKVGISILFQKFKSEEYAQCFSNIGFVPDLSALDLMFNLGSEKSVDYIKKCRNYITS